MRDLFGCWLSAGTVANIVRKCAEALLETELKSKRGLRRSAVIHADETGLRVEGRLHFVHVASNWRMTHYSAAVGRGQTAINDAGVLPRYRGTCVHDGWPAYSFYTQCQHALCEAHLLRELIFFEDLSEDTKAWATPLKELLLEMRREVERVREGGGQRLAEDDLKSLTESYERLIAEGLQGQPPPGVQQAYK
jgi:transposase